MDVQTMKQLEDDAAIARLLAEEEGTATFSPPSPDLTSKQVEEDAAFAAALQFEETGDDNIVAFSPQKAPTPQTVESSPPSSAKRRTPSSSSTADNTSSKKLRFGDDSPQDANSQTTFILPPSSSSSSSSTALNVSNNLSFWQDPSAEADADFAQALQYQLEADEELKIIADQRLAQALYDEEFALHLLEDEQLAQNKIAAAPKDALIVFRKSISRDASGKFKSDDDQMDDDDLQHLKIAQQHFEKRATKLYPNMQLKKLEYVVNAHLHDRYNKKKEQFQAEGRPTDEIYVFHGTHSKNIEKILKEGFKIGGQNGHPASHGAALGFGVYTAADPSVSIGYCNAAKLLLVKVLPGRRGKQPSNGKSKFNCYDHGGVIVVFEPEQLLPLYVIHHAGQNFRHLPAPVNNRGEEEEEEEE